MLCWLLLESSSSQSKGKHILATGLDTLVVAHLSAQRGIWIAAGVHVVVLTKLVSSVEGVLATSRLGILTAYVAFAGAQPTICHVLADRYTGVTLVVYLYYMYACACSQTCKLKYHAQRIMVWVYVCRKALHLLRHVIHAHPPDAAAACQLGAPQQAATCLASSDDDTWQAAVLLIQEMTQNAEALEHLKQVIHCAESNRMFLRVSVVGMLCWRFRHVTVHVYHSVLHRCMHIPASPGSETA